VPSKQPPVSVQYRDNEDLISELRNKNSALQKEILTTKARAIKEMKSLQEKIEELQNYQDEIIKHSVLLNSNHIDQLKKSNFPTLWGSIITLGWFALLLYIATSVGLVL